MASLPIKCPGSDSLQGQLQPVFTKTNLDRAGLVRSVKSSVSVGRVTSTTGESQEFPQVSQTRGSAPSHHRLRSLRLRARPRFIFISVSEQTHQVHRSYEQCVNSVRTPQVVGGLLDVDCDEQTVTSLLSSVVGAFPIDELVDEVEGCNRRKIIPP